jgi:hypothetical protein
LHDSPPLPLVTARGFHFVFLHPAHVNSHCNYIAAGKRPGKKSAPAFCQMLSCAAAPVRETTVRQSVRRKEPERGSRGGGKRAIRQKPSHGETL